MKKRIVVFSGGPLLFTRDELPEALDFLKERRVALDVVDFGTRTVQDEEDSKAKNLKAFVDA
nr:26S proteasome non-ATPase regulatory subunit 4 homolog [Tanacetum cinerariifolium]